MRTFVALELSGSLKEGILALTEELRHRGVRAAWARRATLHLTLKVLGDVEETSLPEVVAAVARASSGVSAFGFETRSLGAFPSPRRPRVLWLGIEPVEELFALQKAVESELEELGFPPEKRRFHPHVTLGRVRDPHAESVQEILSELVAPKERVAVKEVRVMRSTLRPGGAVHKLVEAVPLDGGSRE
ncbi:MAG: RNA 2',3'-cyclic phosphodiesterase [Candidatus Eisenbacteria bacterium]|nr:RNA 2',3'-cyclic phosphodiesterase [Candidatus Eisenbacteria bacterium]